MSNIQKGTQILALAIVYAHKGVSLFRSLNTEMKQVLHYLQYEGGFGMRSIYHTWQDNLGQPFRKQFDNVHYTHSHPCTLAILTFDSVTLPLMIYLKQII